VLASALPEVLLFDLDDTILRFTAGQPNCWRLALELLLSDRGDHDALMASLEREGSVFWAPPERAFWGRQNMHAARRLIACSALSAHGVALDVCHRIADEMTDRKEDLVRPFDGALDTLHSLRRRGHRLGLLTNGSAAFQRRKLLRFELEPLFEIVLIEGELGFGKPDRRVFGAALAHFGVLAQSTWMIGDNLEADIKGARDLGIGAVWYDAHGTGLPRQPLATPDRIITSLSELLG
jgi:putative hydrolase of the HAD superfamily